VYRGKASAPLPITSSPVISRAKRRIISLSWGYSNWTTEVLDEARSYVSGDPKKAFGYIRKLFPGVMAIFAWIPDDGRE
jgi:hypothetical protein